MSQLKRITFASFFFALFSVFLMSNLFSSSRSLQNGFFLSAFAEDGENGGGENVQSSTTSVLVASSTTATKTKTIIQNITEYKPITKTVVVTDEAYQKDTDGDGLVDAIDPDPFKAQSEYFTDTDGDGVPNAFDQHHDEDDFAYYDSETDENGNGIIDSYEQ